MRLVVANALRVAEAAIGQLPWRGELGLVVLAVLQRRATLDHQHLQSAFGEFLGGPSAGDAGAANYGVEIAHQSEAAMVRLEGMRNSSVSVKFSRLPGTGSNTSSLLAPISLV